MTKKVKLNVDGVKVSIDLEEVIEREVQKRLKNIKPKEIVKEVKPYVVNKSGRAQGNTYRLLLEAQLIASSNDYSHVIIVTHTAQYGKDLYRRLVQMAYPNVLPAKQHTTMIAYPNGSTIRFVGSEYFRRNHGFTHGLRNPHILWDTSVLSMPAPHYSWV